MAQLNLHTTPDFDRDLRQFMARRGLKHKSDAIRLALREALEHSRMNTDTPDFRRWRGVAAGAGQRPGRFTDDDLWNGC